MQLGEVIGAVAVVVTLLILIVQVKQNNRSLEESNRLNRASTIDRHADSISRWRGRLMENADLSRIWLAAVKGRVENEEEILRLNNIWIDFINTQRANFVRANTVGELGLAAQAVRSVAAETSQSDVFKKLWKITSNWHRMASPEFVDAVDLEIENFAEQYKLDYSASALEELTLTMKTVMDTQNDQQSQELS